jgi:hypothetical protein
MASSTASATYTKKTYRHEFSKEFMTELSRFSKVHQYDDRITYKSEWQKWTNNEEIAQSMETEKRRLQENGYIGDIDDKMFKAGRYYFRKKTTTTILNNHKEDEDEDEEEPSSTPSTPKDARISETQAATTTTTTTTTTERRTYITMSKQCIQMMDEHIQESAAASASSSSPFKPSICYTNFYETKMTSDEMTKEIGNIVEKYEKTISANSSNRTEDELTQEIMDKIKKTYKNRYYKYISKTTTRTKNNNDNDNDNDSK